MARRSAALQGASAPPPEYEAAPKNELEHLNGLTGQALLAACQAVLETAEGRNDAAELERLGPQLLGFLGFGDVRAIVPVETVRRLAFYAARKNPLKAFIVQLEHARSDKEMAGQLVNLGLQMAKAGVISIEQAHELRYDFSQVVHYIDWDLYFSLDADESREAWMTYVKLRKDWSPAQDIASTVMKLSPRVLRDIFWRCGLTDQKAVDRVLSGYLLDREGWCSISWSEVEADPSVWFARTTNFLIQPIRPAEHSRSGVNELLMTRSIHDPALSPVSLNDRPLATSKLLDEFMDYVGNDVVVHASTSGVDLKPFLSLSCALGGPAYGKASLSHGMANSFTSVTVKNRQLKAWNMIHLVMLLSKAANLQSGRLQYWYTYLEDVPRKAQPFIWGIAGLYLPETVASARNYRDRALLKVQKDVPGEIRVLTFLLTQVWPLAFEAQRSDPSSPGAAIEEVELQETRAFDREVDELAVRFNEIIGTLVSKGGLSAYDAACDRRSNRTSDSDSSSEFSPPEPKKRRTNGQTFLTSAKGWSVGSDSATTSKN